MDGIKSSTFREKFSLLVFDLEKKNLSIKAAIECLKRMEKTFLQTKQKILREEINNASSNKIKDIIVEISNLQKAISDIKLKYNNYEKN